MIQSTGSGDRWLGYKFWHYPVYYTTLDICYFLIKIMLINIFETIFPISKKINLQHIAQDLETF